MLKSISKLMNTYGKTIAIVTISLLIGGTSVGVVSAAIPSSNGSIHGCYNKLSGDLRVINAEVGRSCTPFLESSLSWSSVTQSESGVNVAYAKFSAGEPTLSQATLDPTFTTNIVTSKVSNDGYGWCFKASFTPKIGFIYPGGMLVVRGISQNSDDTIDQYCGSEYTAFTGSLGDVADEDYTFALYR